MAVAAQLLDLVSRTEVPAVPLQQRPLDEVAEVLADLRAGRIALQPAA